MQEIRSHHLQKYPKQIGIIIPFFIFYFYLYESLNTHLNKNLLWLPSNGDYIY